MSEVHMACGAVGVKSSAGYRGFSSNNAKLGPGTPSPCTQCTVHTLSHARTIPSSPHPVSHPSSTPSHASPTPLTQPRQQQTFGQHVPGRVGAMPFLFPIESPLLDDDCPIEGAQHVLSAWKGVPQMGTWFTPKSL